MTLAQRALTALYAYDGNNDYIKVMKYKVSKKGKTLTTKECRYIIKNVDVEPKIVKKWVPVRRFAGQMAKEKHDLKEIPTKIHIDKVLSVDNDKNEIQIWGRFYDYEPEYYSIYLKKNAFINTRDVSDIDFTIIPRQPKEHQIPAVKALLANPRFLLADDMGLGKCLSVNELAYTPNGKIRMGDIRVGDYVIGSDGKKTKVLEVYPQPIKDLYKITFNDGYSTICCKEHMWTVMSNNGSVNNKNRETRYINLTVEQMLDENLILEQHGTGWNEKKTYKFKPYYKQSNGQNKWQIPVVQPIEFETNYTLPIDPYLLGLMLGGGHITKYGSVIFDLHKDDFDEIFNDQPINEIKGYDNKRCNSIGTLKKEIKSLNLNGALSHTKFIPEQYKYASVDDRLSLLHGLMDTDGHCMKSKNGAFSGTEYCTVSEQLADDVADIVHSLGGIVRKKSKIGSYKKEDGTKVKCKVAYRLNIKLPSNMNPFRLKRKSDEYNPPKKYKVGRYIKNIQYHGQGESVCIKVDADDSLFTINHGIVTHNTFSAAAASVLGEFNQILIVCPASVKYNWKKELMFVGVPEDEITIVSGSQWNYKGKYHIINYDILKNFHYKPKVLLGDDGEDYSDVAPKSSLEMMNFDLVIADEAHYLMNKDSDRSQIFEDFVNKVPNLWLLTGTPIPNKIINFHNILKLLKHPLGDDWYFFAKHYCNGSARNRKVGKAIKQFWVYKQPQHLDELKLNIQDVMLRRLSDELDLPEKFTKTVYVENLNTRYNEYLEVYRDWAEKNPDATHEMHIDRLMELRVLISKAKVGVTIDLIENAISQGHKVIVFSCFTESLDMIHRHFYDKAVRIDGSVDSGKRQAIVNEFQKNDKIKLFCGNIIAAGVGITLTSANVEIFNDMSWVPADHAQAEKRAHRMGQEKDVHVIYPILDNSIDTIMYESLQRKKRAIREVIGDVEATHMASDVITEILKDMG